MDLLQQLSDLWLKLKYAGPTDNTDFPQVAQDRYTRTPVFYKKIDPSLGGTYVPDETAGKQLSQILTYGPTLDPETLRGLDSLAKEWNNKQGYVAVNTNVGFQQPGTLPHEVAHAIYDKAGLRPKSSELIQAVPSSIKDLILNSPTYSRMPKPYAGSDEQVVDEGLGFTVGTPAHEGYNSDEVNFINQVASKITDPNLKQSLYRVYQSMLKRK